MSTYVYSLELQHHGIKGMKWGIRRFQRKDGSLTPAGKKRYDDDDAAPKQKSTHRSRLEEKYRQSGMTAKQAAVAADKRIRAEKVIAVTGGLTVAAATAYFVNKNVRERADGIIKSGTKLQVVANDPNKNFDRAFYTAYKESDKTKYKGLYGKQIRSAGFEAHKITLNTDQDVKIVSRKKAADTFADLYKNDPEFKEAFQKSNSMMKTNGLVKARDKVVGIASKEMTDKQLKRAGYDAFNIGLVNHTPEGNLAAKKFYDRLKEQGYDAVMDINDQKYSGYKSKKPVIVFNRANKISVSDVKKMTDEQILKDVQKARSQMELEQLAKEGAAYVGLMTGATIVGNKLTEANKPVRKRR